MQIDRGGRQQGVAQVVALGGQLPPCAAAHGGHVRSASNADWRSAVCKLSSDSLSQMIDLDTIMAALDF